MQTLLHYLPPFVNGVAGGGLLLLRLVFGVAMVAAGLPKITAPWHWMDQEQEMEGMPSILQALGAWTIFGGGVAY